MILVFVLRLFFHSSLFSFFFFHSSLSKLVQQIFSFCSLFLFGFLALFLIIWSKRIITIKHFFLFLWNLASLCFWVLMEWERIKSMLSSEVIDDVKIHGRQSQHHQCPRASWMPSTNSCTFPPIHQMRSFLQFMKGVLFFCLFYISFGYYSTNSCFVFDGLVLVNYIVG